MITLLQLRPYPGDVVAPSPNHGMRRAPAIEGIVLHATQDAGNEGRTVEWMRSPKSQVSCHLLVSRKGRVTRLVGDQQRAWHAGASRFRGKSDVNSVTLGIEIANRNDGEPFTDAQYARVADIVAHYCRQGISLDDVVGHGDIAPGRRRDPVGFDWGRFREMVQRRLVPAEVVATSPIALPRAERATPIVVAARPSDTTPAAARTRSAPAPAPQRRASPPRAHKPAFRSRTLWLNGLTVLAAAAALLGETLKLAFWVGLPLPQEITVWALFALGVVNIMLRFRTTQPVCPKQNAQPATPSG